MAEQKATNVTWQDGEVTRENRYEILRQKGATIWFTGLSGSGKSTIAVALENALFKRGKLSYRLDGDNVRLGINKNLGFSEEDRTENIRRIGEISKLFGDAGTIALSSFISPYRARSRRSSHDSTRLPISSLLRYSSTAHSRSQNRVTPRACTRKRVLARSRISPASTIPMKRRLTPRFICTRTK